MISIRNAQKLQKVAEQAAAAQAQKKGTLDEMTPKEASAVFEAQKKVGAAASVTNPAPKASSKKKGSGKKKAAGVGKKKAVKK